PYDSEGNRIDFPGGDIAVKTIIDEHEYSQDQRVTLRAFGSFFAQLDFGAFSDALDGLKFRTNFGPDIETYRRGIYVDGKSVVRSGSSFASLEKRQRLSYTLDNLLLYNRTFGMHNLTKNGIRFQQTIFLFPVKNGMLYLRIMCHYPDGTGILLTDKYYLIWRV